MATKTKIPDWMEGAESAAEEEIAEERASKAIIRVMVRGRPSRQGNHHLQLSIPKGVWGELRRAISGSPSNALMMLAYMKLQELQQRGTVVVVDMDAMTVEEKDPSE